MKCYSCGEEYDETMFPYCPFCLAEINVDDTEVEEVKEVETIKQEAVLDGAKEGADTDNNTLIKEVAEDEKSIRENDIDIENIPMLSMRSMNVLRRNGIFKLSELQNFLLTHKLSELRNLGRESESEIITAVIFMKNQTDLDGFIKENSGKTLGNNSDSNDRTIQDVFSENLFGIFVRYCRNCGMEYISDLNDFDFYELNNVEGIGKRKLESIIKRYNEISNISFQNKVSKNDTVKVFFSNINGELDDVSIKAFTAMGINSRTVNLLTTSGITRIGELRRLSHNGLVKIIGKRNIESFEMLNETLSLSLKEVFDVVLARLDDTDEYDIFLKRASGLTLQEIADQKGVTRERIRQVANKFYQKISALIGAIEKVFLQQKGYITVSELLDIFDNDDYNKIVIYSCKQDEELEYLDFADVFVPKRKDGTTSEQVLIEIATEFVNEGINLYENLEELETVMYENGFSYIECGEFINLIQKYGYKLYGDYATKGNKSYGFLCEKIIVKEFPNGIKLHEGKDLDKLRELAMKQYGDIGIPDSNRALSARLADYLVLSGRGAVIAKENIHVELSVLEEIKEYIDQSDIANIYYTELFARFEGLLKMTSNVDNYNFLHGVLMLYYPDEYEYSRDCLTKHDRASITVALNERIKIFIMKKGNPVHKNELRIKFSGVSDAMLFRAITEDNELFQWENNYYTTSRLMGLDENSKSTIRDIIINIMNENYGYCSDALLYDMVKYKANDFLLQNRIESSCNLFYTCQCMYENEFEFRRPHIGKKGLFFEVSTKNVALLMLENDNEISYKQYNVIAEHFKWPVATASAVFCEIEKDYIRVSADCYVKKEKCKVLEADLEQIENVINRSMNEGLVSIMNFDSWQDLPDIGYEWNPFLLHKVLDNFSDRYKIIETRMADRRYERGIVIDASLELKEYADVVGYFLKKKNIYEITENGLLSLLVVNGLAYKVIPKEIYNSEAIRYENETFTVKV